MIDDRDIDTSDIPEMTDEDLARAIGSDVRRRIMEGKIKSGADVVALRRWAGLTQKLFAKGLGISVHTLRNWEQGRRKPDGPALALMRIVARRPNILRYNLNDAA